MQWLLNRTYCVFNEAAPKALFFWSSCGEVERKVKTRAVPWCRAKCPALLPSAWISGSCCVRGALCQLSLLFSTQFPGFLCKAWLLGLSCQGSVGHKPLFRVEWKLVCSLNIRSCYFCDVKPLVGMTKSILDGSSQDTGEILCQFSQHAHTVMKPLRTNVANIKRNRKVKIAYGELRSWFFWPIFFHWPVYL